MVLNDVRGSEIAKMLRNRYNFREEFGAHQKCKRVKVYPFFRKIIHPGEQKEISKAVRRYFLL